tara:strand:- start:176 stop:457 length:282 start_codon:yes stop_codon:yes gene_type:complete
MMMKNLNKYKKLILKLNDQEKEPVFLKVKPRDTVLVGDDEVCKVLSFVAGARDPSAPTLFQVVNVDTGEIKFVHAHEVKEIICSYQQQHHQKK